MVSTRSSKRAPSPIDEPAVAPPKKAQKVTSVSKEQAQDETKHVEVILLDIEGTVAPITFVKDVLFPYALKALPSVLSKQWDSAEFAPYRDAFPAEHRTSPDALEAHVKDLTEKDVKVAYLKNLQGYLWEDGYKSGAYSTPLYSDVIEFFERWPSKDANVSSSQTNGEGSTSLAKDDSKNGTNGAFAVPSPAKDLPLAAKKQVAIYSSGSIFAQKLLFEHVQLPNRSNSATAEDSSTTMSTRNLNPSISAYFDTTNAGLKASAASYNTIAKSLDIDPSKVLFLSDVPAEIYAAREAGMQAIVVEREGNKPLTEEDRAQLKVIKSLSELDI